MEIKEDRQQTVMASRGQCTFQLSGGIYADKELKAAMVK